MTIKSLRSQLLVWLLVPLAAAVLADAYFTYRNARDAATAIQERMLIGAARVIGEQIQIDEGVLQVSVPPSALELFQSADSDRVFYRVTYADRILSGYYDLPLPRNHLMPEQVAYFDTIMRDRPVHCVAFAQPVLTSPDRKTVLIQVAQTLQGRNQLAKDIWFATIRGHVFILFLIVVLLAMGLRRGLRPVIALRDRILARQPGTLERLEDGGLPTELAPLASAVNDYVVRLDKQMSANSEFIANASHQLRTPFALLNTQVDYAIRHEGPLANTETLKAISETTQHGIRLVNQLLALARSDASMHVANVRETFDLSEAVRHTLEAHAGAALHKSIDLGCAGVVEPTYISGVAWQVSELLANLVDNAIRYTHAGGIVTVSVLRSGSAVILQVEDNGPGIAPEEREHVFERFYRLGGADSEGCGLGLSIVRDIARGMGSDVELDSPAGHSGLIVTVRFRAVQPDPSRQSSDRAGNGAKAHQADATAAA